MKNVLVEIYSDVVCPWCFLGKHRLAKALRELEGRLKAEVRWLPYELNPEMPKQGLGRLDYLGKKFGSSDYLEQAEARLAELGRELGLEYNFSAAQKIPNTFNAHRLVWLASQQGLEGPVVEALFRAYFTYGKDIGEPGVLAEIAFQEGLKEERVREFLESKEGEKEVRQLEAKAFELGVEGVPFYIFNNQYAVSGAQDPKVFVKALEKAA